MASNTEPTYFKTEPRPYQRLIVEKTYSAPYMALFLKQGLGKTKIILDMAAKRFLEGRERFLIIISKKSVLENWLHEEIPLHLAVPYCTQLYSTETKNHVRLPNRFPDNSLGIILMNDGCVRTKHGLNYLEKTLKMHASGLVIDESTIIKNPKAQISKVMLNLAGKASWRRILSGEPAPQGAVDYYSQYKFLENSILGTATFTAYKNIFCEQNEIWVNGRCVRTPTRAFNPLAKEIFEQAVKPYTIRLRKEDVLKELPEKQYIVRKYQLPASVRRVYDKLRDAFMTEFIIQEKTHTLTATMAMARVTRLHQIVSGHIVSDEGGIEPMESGRFEVLCDILEERESTAKVIIWAHYRHTIEQLYNKLEERYGPGCVKFLYGGLTENERTSRIKSFKTDPKVRFLVSNPATAGWGLTLTEADTAIYYSNSYNWEHRDQSEDRIHRIGQTANSVSYYDLVAMDTVDQRILDVLRSKADFSKSVLNNYVEWLS